MQSSLINMRAYPQSTKQYRKTDALSKEWDVGLNLPDQDYQVEAERIVKLVNELDTSYALVGGVEFVLPRTDVLGQFRQAVKSGATVGKYHIHVALVFNTYKTRDQVLTLLGRATSPYRNYARPRQSKYPYVTWKYHHIKPDTKVGDCQLYERGTLPDDDILDPEICEMIIRLGTKFGAGREVAIIKEHLTKLECEDAHAKTTRNPVATLDKAKARLQLYTENLALATTDEDKKKWEAYIYLVKRDHFPDSINN